ncbi:hypothetical protein N9494_00925 [Polaribacter sp.]|nr:hypothetical protein [Polaribacter sp.]
MEIIYDIFLFINVPIIFWALLIGIGAIIKGWPEMFGKQEKIIKKIFLFYVTIIAAIVWLYIIVNGFSLLKSELFVL